MKPSLTLLFGVVLTAFSRHADAAEGGDASTPLVVPDAGDAGSSESSASDGGIGLGDPETQNAGGGVTISLQPPQSWSGAAPDKASLPSLSEIQAGKVTLAWMWRPSVVAKNTDAETSLGDVLMLTCVTAPATDWVPGVESLVFERMSVHQKQRLASESSLEAFVADPPEKMATFFRQRFKARGELGEGHGPGHVRVLAEERSDRPHGHVRIVGQHLVMAPAPGLTVMACSIACSEVRRPNQHAFVCDASLASLRVQGQLSAEPSPAGLLVRIAVGARKSPAAVLGLVAGLLMVVSGVVVLARAAARRHKPGTAHPS